eukprot:11204491-Karenia_brevis.AAC.1
MNVVDEPGSESPACIARCFRQPYTMVDGCLNEDRSGDIVLLTIVFAGKCAFKAFIFSNASSGLL